MQFFIVKIINAFKTFAHADRPGQGRAFNLQFVFDIRQNIQRRQAIAVHFVNKSYNRRIAQAADFHELLGLRLHAFGAVNHHQRAVHGGEHAVSVFGKILMAGCVQQIDFAIRIFKFHDRRGDGNAAFLFNGHPVAQGMLGRFAGLYRAGHLNGAAEKQQLFGERGFARIGMADDAECAAAFNFFL